MFDTQLKEDNMITPLRAELRNLKQDKATLVEEIKVLSASKESKGPEI